MSRKPRVTARLRAPSARSAWSSAVDGGTATALNLVAEGVPAGHGEPVEGIANRATRDRGPLYPSRPVPRCRARDDGRPPLDPAERGLPAEIKVRRGCRDERLQGLRGRLELVDGRVDVPP